MENLDMAVLDTAIDWLKNGERVVLTTVAKTWGSSPRPAGSMLVWRPDGRFEGSLSGGCIEEELLAVLEKEIPQTPITITYGITKEQAVSRGLPCGGEVTVVSEALSSAEELEDMMARLAERQRVRRSIQLASGESTVDEAPSGARTALEADRLDVVYEPKWRLLIVGAGQLSGYVAKFALALGYEVCVCDPRENYRFSWMEDDATVSAEMPDDFVVAKDCDAQTGVLALTHDPKLDDLAIMEALNSPAFYVGSLGSSRTNGARRERLREHFEMTEAQLDFLSGPIGIDLNTRTASEIALAVMTEITARRNHVNIISERIPVSPVDSNSAAQA